MSQASKAISALSRSKDYTCAALGPKPISYLIKMGAQIELSRRLRWADTDATGRLHFPRIFEIVEEAESELLRSIDWPVGINEAEYDLPRVHVDCRFLRPIIHDSQFRLQLSVNKLGRSSIQYKFQVFDEFNALAIDGSMTVVTSRNGTPTEIPPALRRALAGDLSQSKLGIDR